MKKISITILCAALLMGCSQPKPANAAFTIYEGWPLVPNADVEPVRVPIENDNLYFEGDTVWIDTTGTIIDWPVRDAESGQPITYDLQRVVLRNKQ